MGDRLLLSGYFRDDPPNIALSADNSVTGSSLANSTTVPPLGTTLTASRVNPGFMGRLGPEYPDVYDHRYATISAPTMIEIQLGWMYLLPIPQPLWGPICYGPS